MEYSQYHELLQLNDVMAFDTDGDDYDYWSF